MKMAPLKFPRLNNGYKSYGMNKLSSTDRQITISPDPLRVGG